MSCSGAVTPEERAQEVAAELGVVDIPGMREHLAMVLHDRADQGQKGARFFKFLKGVNSRGKKKELQGLELLETYVKCLRFTLQLKPGKPRADRCTELKSAVDAHPELQRHIAAGMIPNVPSAVVSAHAKSRARCYENVKKKKEDENEKKRRRLEEKESELEETSRMMIEDGAATKWRDTDFVTAYITAQTEQLLQRQEGNSAWEKELRLKEQFLAKATLQRR